ncbi:MAG TPA: hypothetical protein VGC24_00765 [Burkholderiaceae bacterium]
MIPVPSLTLISKEQVELLKWAAHYPERRQSVVEMLDALRKLHVDHLGHIERLAEIKATHERLIEAGSVIATNIETLEEVLSELAA